MDIAPWIRGERNEKVDKLFKIKTENLRRFTHQATLITFNTIPLRGTEEAFKDQLAILDLPPILRLFYAINFIPQERQNETIGIIKEIIEAYNDTLKVLKNKTLREYLEGDLESREVNYIEDSLNKNGIRLRNNFERLRKILVSPQPSIEKKKPVNELLGKLAKEL